MRTTRTVSEKCPVCGSPAAEHEPEAGRWHTVAWVSCLDEWCERSEQEQRARQEWYLAAAPAGWKGGLRRWKLW